MSEMFLFLTQGLLEKFLPQTSPSLSPMLNCSNLAQGYEAVYERLGVRLEDRGESYYNPMLPGLVQELTEQHIAEESQGAKVIFVQASPHDKSLLPTVSSSQAAADS